MESVGHSQTTNHGNSYLTRTQRTIFIVLEDTIWITVEGKVRMHQGWLSMVGSTALLHNMLKKKL